VERVRAAGSMKHVELAYWQGKGMIIPGHLLCAAVAMHGYVRCHRCHAWQPPGTGCTAAAGGWQPPWAGMHGCDTCRSL
jgi:hypothetical protein